MRRVLPLSLALLATCVATAGAATLPANQRFVDSTGKLSLLTRSGGKGYLNGRTRCGRLADQRVTLKGGTVRSRKGARIRVTGTIPSTSTVRIKIVRRRCSFSFTLRRNTKPE